MDREDSGTSERSRESPSFLFARSVISLTGFRRVSVPRGGRTCPRRHPRERFSLPVLSAPRRVAVIGFLCVSTNCLRKTEYSLSLYY